MKICRSLWRAISHSGLGVCLVALALSAHVLNAGTLPEGMEFVDYIESSGTQYIDTGFSPSNKNVKIEVTYRFVSLPPVGSRHYVFGSSFSVNNSIIRLQYSVGKVPEANCFIGFGNKNISTAPFES